MRITEEGDAAFSFRDFLMKPTETVRVKIIPALCPCNLMICLSTREGPNLIQAAIIEESIHRRTRTVMPPVMIVTG